MYTTETRVRTFARSLTWRASGVALAILLTWYLTGNPALGAELGVAYNLIRLSTHFFHDRLWARWQWGMLHPNGQGPVLDPPVDRLFSKETRVRTFARSLTWRISGVILTVLLAVALTGDLRLGLELGVSYNLIRLSTHYFHDRAWAAWAWGLAVHGGDPPAPPPKARRWRSARHGEAEAEEPARTDA